MPTKPRAPKSDATKQKDAERMYRDFTRVGYSARREEAAAFKDWCARHGTTMHAVIRAYVLQLLSEDNETPEE